MSFLLLGSALSLRKEISKILGKYSSQGTKTVQYDPSDLSTLFQDSAGTIPVTAVEQPVGLMLDKSTGGAQVEVITNAADRNFTSNTGYWTLEAGITISGGALNFSNAGSSNACYKTSGVVAGNWYVATVTVVSVTSGAVKLNLGSTFSSVISTPGTYTFKFRAGGAGMGVYSNTVGTTATISYISYQQLPGNHAFQATAGNRPTLSARVNLLTYSEQFDNAVWTRQANVNITANSIVAPDGTTTADTYASSSASVAVGTYQLQSGTNSTAYSSSIYIKAGNISTFRFGLTTNSETATAYYDFDVSAVTATSAAILGFTSTSATITSVGGGWYRCVVFGTTPASGVTQIGVFPRANAIGYVYVWGADLRPTNIGSGIPSYQRVTTATDYDTAGFPLYLKANGSSSAMATNSIDFSTVTSDGQTRRNLLTYPTAFDNAIWVKNGGLTISQNTTSAPDGSVSADKFVFGGSTRGFANYSLNLTSSSYTITFYAKAGEADVAECSVYRTGDTDGTAPAAFFRLTGSGSVLSANAAFTSTDITLVSGQTVWYRITAKITNDILNVCIGGRPFANYTTGQTNANPFTAAVLTDGLYLWGAQVESGSTATTFQDIGTDKMTIVTGVRKLSDATYGIIAELSSSFSTHSGTFVTYCYTNVWNSGSTGNIYASISTAASYQAPISNVIADQAAIATPLLNKRVNGLQAATTSATQGTGTYGNYPLYLFAREGTSLWFNGHFYGATIIGATVTSKELLKLEKYQNIKAGVLY